MSKIERRVVFSCAAVVFIAIATIVWLMAFKGTSSSASTLHTVEQPKTAGMIAQQAGCSNFVDMGPSMAGGALDSGTCQINGVKYGIDTFLSQTDRDNWILMAGSHGVNPKWETATSVIYKSING